MSMQRLCLSNIVKRAASASAPRTRQIRSIRNVCAVKPTLRGQVVRPARVALNRAATSSQRVACSFVSTASTRRATPLVHLRNSVGHRHFASDAAVIPASNVGSIPISPAGLYTDMSLPPSFNKILIANRGEIACRVIQTAKALGIKTVAVYSEVDAASKHVAMADEAYYIGGNAAQDSYLRGDVILEVAKKTGAQAIHPGYGFLSENAKFAEKCEAAGVVFIGPPASAIHAMGSKSASKDIMTGSGVPCVPGYHGENQDPEFLEAEAHKIGFPIMIKAVLGGGGKGMRISMNKKDFKENLSSCIREAKSSFNDERVLLERYIQKPRHVEFQVFADKHGNAVHLFERDCSVQRRHQKVLEESPAPGLSQELRDQMGKSAVDAARAVGYVGAGTVEFIVDAETEEYFFMEMNTRLQVEHPVTEMVSGRDLVQWQLHVAYGHKLPADQSTVSSLQQNARGPVGCSVEARIYAENPYNNFLPCTGHLSHLRPPTIPTDRTVRVETGVREGDDVSIFYDPMISKLVVWAPTREQALNKLLHCLSEYHVVGPPTNIPFLRSCIKHPEFAAGRVDTSFIPRNEAQLKAEQPLNSAAAGIAALFLMHKRADDALESEAAAHDFGSPWNSTKGFRVNAVGSTTIDLTNHLLSGEAGEDIRLVARGVSAASDHAESAYMIDFHPGEAKAQSFPLSGVVEIEEEDDSGNLCSASVQAQVGGRVVKASVVQDDEEVHVFLDGTQATFSIPKVSFGARAHDSGTLSPMAGKIVKVQVEPGQTVSKGDALIVMEAMKMEHVIRAPRDAKVDKVLFGNGAFVEGGKVLITFES